MKKKMEKAVDKVYKVHEQENVSLRQAAYISALRRIQKETALKGTKEQMAEYIPGVCNIGPAEIARRRRAGWTGLVATVVLWALFVFFDIPAHCGGFFFSCPQ